MLGDVLIYKEMLIYCNSELEFETIHVGRCINLQRNANILYILIVQNSYSVFYKIIYKYTHTVYIHIGLSLILIYLF